MILEKLIELFSGMKYIDIAQKIVKLDSSYSDWNFTLTLLDELFDEVPFSLLENDFKRSDTTERLVANMKRVISILED